MDKFVCYECNKSYRLRNSFNNHRRHFHREAENFICNDCNKVYPYKSSLRSHIIAKHIDSTAMDQINCEIFECYECRRKYSRKPALVYHISMKHLKNNNKEKFECEKCSRKFWHNNNLKRHIHRKHSNKPGIPTKKKNFICVLCRHSFPSEFDILHHFQKVHDVKIIEENYSFNSQIEFNVWKDNVENQHYCSYIKSARYLNKNTNQIKNVYRCNRSGFYVPPTARKRKLQSRGSKKINGFCPSKIIYTSDNTFHKVVFTSIHIGHSNDYKQMAHMKYSHEEKNIVAKKLASGLPVKRIIEDLVPPSSTSKSKDCLRKINLLNEKDVYNIAQSYGISVKNCEQPPPNNVTGIETWVINNKESVRFYKRQGESDESEFKLNDDDFILVVMRADQIEKFLKFSADMILIDGTRSISNKMKFFLHTVLIKDEYGEGYPTCFLITNRNDALVFDIMFSCLRDKFGSIDTKVLMTDMQTSCLKSWIRIMGTNPTHHLFCTWHVIRAWHKNFAKVKLAIKKERVKQRLMKLLYEENANTFHNLLEEFLNDEDEDLQTFIQYFEDKFGLNYDKWAYCYHLDAGVNTNTSLDHFYRVFKYHHESGFTIEQVQDTLNCLDKLLWKIICSGVRADIMGRKLSDKTEILKQNHKKAVTLLNTCQIMKMDYNGKTWKMIYSSKEIEKEEKSESFLLQRVNDDCCDCPMLCEDCQFCCHQFTCSCLQNKTKNIMCEHIHLLCLKEMQEIVPIYSTNIAESEIIFSDSDISLQDSIEETIFLDAIDDEITEVTEVTDHQLKINESFDVQSVRISEGRKNQLISQFTELVEKSGDVRTFKFLEKIFKMSECTLASSPEWKDSDSYFAHVFEECKRKVVEET